MQALDDVMDHAEDLQKQAASAVGALDAAAAKSSKASEQLIACAASLQNQLTTQVAAAVAQKFDAAVTDASGSIATEVKAKTADLVKLASSLERTVRVAQNALQAQREELDKRVLVCAGIGLVTGVALTVGLTVVIAHFTR